MSELLTSVVCSSKSLKATRSSLIHFSGPALFVTSLSSTNFSFLPWSLYLHVQRFLCSLCVCVYTREESEHHFVDVICAQDTAY